MEKYQAIKELIAISPCLNCRNPNCVKYCPVHQNIPTFIDYAKRDEYDKAYMEIIKNSVLPAICGVLCPHEKQCEGHCVKNIKGNPVKIGLIEANIANIFENKVEKITDNLKNYHFAIIGGGVAGISAALRLASHGGKVTIYEKNDCLGGAVKKAIPDFRFDDKIIEKITKNLEYLGVKISYNKTFGKNLSLDDLSKDDYLFFGLGTMFEKTGFKENTDGIYQGIKVLEQYKDTRQLPRGKKCLIIGAGNVAMDVSRVFAKNGYDTTIVYRRTLQVSPALKREIEDASLDGVKFLELHNPVRPVYEENVLKGLEVEKMALLAELDQSGRPKFCSTGETLMLESDIIVEAIGSSPDYEVFKSFNWPIFSGGWIKPNEGKAYASYQNYYFIGDFVNGPTTIVNAMKSALEATQDIIDQLKER